MADVIAIGRKIARLAHTAAWLGGLVVAVRFLLVRVEEVDRHGVSLSGYGSMR